MNSDIWGWGGKGGVGLEIALNSHSSSAAAWLLGEGLLEHKAVKK